MGHGRSRLSEPLEAVFAGSPSPHILLTTGLTIIGVNAAYLRAVGRTRDQLMGRQLFDAFPAPEDSAHADGHRALAASFARVSATGEADTLPAARYDVAVVDGDPDSPTEQRWWTFITSAVRNGDGTVTMLLHRVEDITDLAAGLGDGALDGSDAARLAVAATEFYARGRESQELTGRLRAAQLETQRALEEMAIGYLALDREFRITFVNAEGAVLTKASREDLPGTLLWDAFPGTRDLVFGETYQRVMASRVAESFEAFYPALDLWFEVRAVPSGDGLGLYFLDITTRVRAQQSVLRTAERLAILADVSASLARTLDAPLAMQALAAVVVPALADWCIITVDSGAGLTNIAAAHRSAQEQPRLRAYADAHVAALSGTAVVSTVMRTGEHIATPELDPEMLARRVPDATVRGLLQRLGPSSGLAVPIRTPEHVLGVLALWQGAGRSPHDDADIETALEIGRRAGLLIENARLYAGQRRLAEALQRSLLTDPPQPDHLQFAVRYRPAAQEAQVGGDWYDAFFTSDGATCLVVGDVAGHDGEAAATMGQVRNLLRGLAYTLAEPPAAVLSALDRALLDLSVESLATAVLCRVEQTADEAGLGRRRLRWSNAGHPPPLMIEPDGSVRLLTTPADLLLGLDSATRRDDHEVALAPGATVLLYTDGLVERRGASIDDGLAWLLGAVEELGPLPLEDLCDALLRSIGETSEDDVALIALRAHDQGAPRPAEAGQQTFRTGRAHA